MEKKTLSVELDIEELTVLRNFLSIFPKKFEDDGEMLAFFVRQFVKLIPEMAAQFRNITPQG